MTGRSNMLVARALSTLGLLVALAACSGGGASPLDAATDGGADQEPEDDAGQGPRGCPAMPPKEGFGCSGSSCYYEDCNGVGRTVALCSKGAWAIETAPCGPIACMGRECASGEICLQKAGDAQLFECIANGCGTGAVSCGCLQSCVGDCSPAGSASDGFTVYCTTCPSGMCQ